MRRIVVFLSVTMLAALLIGATPAVAGEQARRDARGDTAQLGGSGPKSRSIDVVASTNSYRGRTLKLSVTVDQLAARGYAAFWRIKTRNGDYALSYSREGARPRIYFDPAPRRTCKGIGVRTSTRKDRITARVPRSCLGGADVVRVALGMVKQTDYGVDVDDARRRGYSTRQRTYTFAPPMRRN